MIASTSLASLGDFFGDAECAVLQVEERVKGIFIGALVGLAAGVWLASMSPSRVRNPGPARRRKKGGRQ